MITRIIEGCKRSQLLKGIEFDQSAVLKQANQFMGDMAGDEMLKASEKIATENLPAIGSLIMNMEMEYLKRPWLAAMKLVASQRNRISK